MIAEKNRRDLQRMIRNRELGRRGEEQAASYIEEQGYTIIGRNVRLGRYEIDIIAVEAKVLVFIEVKTRRTYRYGLPCEAVNPIKQQHIKQAAVYFVERLRRKAVESPLSDPISNYVLRFDIIEVYYTSEDHGWLRHMKSCF